MYILQPTAARRSLVSGNPSRGQESVHNFREEGGHAHGVAFVQRGGIAAGLS